MTVLTKSGPRNQPIKKAPNPGSFVVCRFLPIRGGEGETEIVVLPDDIGAVAHHLVARPGGIAGIAEIDRTGAEPTGPGGHQQSG